MSAKVYGVEVRLNGQQAALKKANVEPATVSDGFLTVREFVIDLSNVISQVNSDTEICLRLVQR